MAMGAIKDYRNVWRQFELRAITALQEPVIRPGCLLPS
ncbi:hypothetical protein O59_001373 [Cellvibrio sp. BR]|nr:hypothetical protein O59_001373 [Cellvibrio sp. BR]